MRFLLWTALLLAFVASLAFLGVVGIYASYAKDLPDYTQLDRRRVFQTARILDRNGQLLGEFNDPEGGRRTLVPIDRDPEGAPRRHRRRRRRQLLPASRASTSSAILRALYQNVRGREIVSGASTITQQLVKNTLLTPEQTPDRKIKEAILAWEVSRRYSKDRILELYLNEVYYGNLAYGVEAAAQTYFGRSVERAGPGGADVHRRAAPGAVRLRPVRQPAGGAGPAGLRAGADGPPRHGRPASRPTPRGPSRSRCARSRRAARSRRRTS